MATIASSTVAIRVVGSAARRRLRSTSFKPTQSEGSSFILKRRRNSSATSCGPSQAWCSSGSTTVQVSRAIAARKVGGKASVCAMTRRQSASRWSSPKPRHRPAGRARPAPVLASAALLLWIAASAASAPSLAATLKPIPASQTSAPPRGSPPCGVPAPQRVEAVG